LERPRFCLSAMNGDSSLVVTLVDRLSTRVCLPTTLLLVGVVNKGFSAASPSNRVPFA
jgi:sugar phosphate permease